MRTAGRAWWLAGLAVALTRKTKVDKDGGSEPVWNETLVFECVDQYLLEVRRHVSSGSMGLWGWLSMACRRVCAAGRWRCGTRT